jgi:arylsulfatase A-like enzyme
MSLNVLLITLDQFRADCLSVAGHPLVKTPNLDRLAKNGVRLTKHYSQCAPCSPGRASLYTGMYQMNHRVVANGTPLNREFDNVALLAKRAGYWPTLFGYTDQAIDPRDTTGADDWRLNSYEGVLPGFDCKLFIPENHELWIEHLRANGFDLPMDAQHALRTEPDRPEQFGLSTFLTDHLLGWLKKQDGPWFAHASYLRPHPPFAAAGKWSKAYDPADVELPIAPGSDLHPAHEMFMQIDSASAPADEAGKRHMRAQYYGMIGDVDEQLGRVWDALVEMNMWDNTMIIVTADHGEQLGDHGLKEKLGFFPQSYHILGIVRDPRNSAQFGTTVNEFTENIDIFPTIAEALGQPVPSQCDGLPLTPFLSGDQPPWWRDAATYEYDWRSWFIRQSQRQWPWDQRLEQQHLTTRVYDNRAYVQFGNGSWLSFDLAADPTWRTYLTDTSATLQMTQDMLVWRSRHTNRQLTSMLIENGGIGQWPDGVAWRD